MSAHWKNVHGWFAECSLIRRAAEALFRCASREHLAHFDRQTPARTQTRTLLTLLHRAQSTRFGLDHDFRRIRTLADFRRLVPLRTRADLWREYWQPVFPNLAGATWPGPALRPSSSSLQTAHRHALRTALALIVRARPRTRLLSGGLLLLNEDGPTSLSERDSLPERLPALVRPYARIGGEPMLEQYASLPATCLVGPVERLLPLLEAVKRVRGTRRLADVWPDLAAILFTRRSSAAPVQRLRDEAGDALLLEMAGRAEGPIAVEDPRHGSFRLLHDHGVYFEFVPLDRAGEPRCPRYGIDEVEIGVPYELALTSPAGLWACRVGRTIRLENREAMTFRFLDTAVAQPMPLERRARRTDLVPSTLPLPAAHPQNADNPAAPLGSSSRSPWSILADRE